MEEKWETSKEVSHVLSTLRGLCLHGRERMAPPLKDCIQNYQCGNCAYDQWLDFMEERTKEDFASAKAAKKPMHESLQGPLPF